ncbi:MAG: NADH-quinone oxidoreductase subunit N [Planctomycetaceae bacterium]|nr:NADH-quinone oxidoreductase subunit N [Planctomycetaceae bacterium]
MTFDSLINGLVSGDLPRSAQIFAPELVLCVTIVALLLVRMLCGVQKLPACWVALIGTLLAFVGVFAQFMYLKTASPEALDIDWLFRAARITEDGVGTQGGYFTSLLMHDQFTLFIRLGILLFSVLVIALTVLTGIPDNEDGPDFYTLLLRGTIGMLVATSANHLLMMFVGVEMMSVPSYAMVGFLKGRRQSSEAALKYVVYGAGAAGVMLYGISLLAGLLGTGNMPELAARFVTVMGSEPFAPTNATAVTVVLGVMMVLVGLAFKLSLAPFHFWCPDAFEGASAEVAGFLSVASKAAAFALLVRFVLAFGGTEEVLYDLRSFIGIGLAVIAAISMTLGNLAAYSQTNVKRLLAYSTIAHAGYMVMAVAALLVLWDAPESSGFSQAELVDASVRSVEGLMYYLGVYLFMNLVAFAVVALLRNETYSEEIDSYNGLVHQNTATKVLCVCMGVALFSLVGIPPFGGFFAKLLIFMAVFKAGYLHWAMWALLAIAGANTVFSLFYYLRVLKAMFINPEPAERRVLRTPGVVGVYVLLITVPILALGASTLQDRLTRTAEAVAQVLFQ